MMGFLNKFMDAIGVDLEASTVAETKTTLYTSAVLNFVVNGYSISGGLAP